MGDEYIKKLSQMKKDICVIQDSLFFEMHTLQQQTQTLQEQNKAQLEEIQKLKEELLKAREYQFMYEQLCK